MTGEEGMSIDWSEERMCIDWSEEEMSIDCSEKGMRRVLSMGLGLEGCQTP